MAGAITIKNLTKRYGSFAAVDDVSITIPEGHFVSLLGPSGCGKTTTLRMLAGFVPPDEGEIAVDGAVVSRPGHVQAAEDRQMGMVFQSYAVWPHMTVFDNVAYPLRFGEKKVSDKGELRRRVDGAIELVGLSGQQAKFPNALSGGQQQRVALARALIAEPRILLLDEPLSNLDAKLRESMRFELRSLQRRLGITTVFVTHSQEEALLLSDMVVVMRSGKVIEQNDPETLYRSPRTDFVADFIGLANFFDGPIVSEAGGRISMQTPAGLLTASGTAGASGAKLMIRPESITLTSAGETRPDFENQLPGRVDDVFFNGNIVEYMVSVEGLQEKKLRVQGFPPRRFSAGEVVSIGFSADDAKILEVA
ncbi:ABC transporter ATP-binding protein [Devosia honganensis]|uniref:ABC transporter ATP-binding protein n=1 Tax=Devosia honganensis TaxID=1610527 RepID=A0ABV7WZJ2_9HYPH